MAKNTTLYFDQYLSAQDSGNELAEVTVCATNWDYMVSYSVTDCTETWNKCGQQVDCTTGAPLEAQHCTPYIKQALGCTPPAPPTPPSSGGGGGTTPPTPTPTPTINKILCGIFADIINKICKTEGGYVNNPNDKGGPTNHGIAWATWQEYSEKYLGVEPTLGNLINLTTADAQKIYKGEYWDAIYADQIQDGDMRYALADFYVNAKGNALKTLQRTLNQLGANVTVDGAMGSQTLNAINQANPVDLYNKFNDNRQAYYNRLCNSPNIPFADREKNKKNINGWTNRVNSFKDKTNNNMYNVNC